MKLGGRVQRGVRRALLLHREVTTSELLRRCYREAGRTRRERKNRARGVWFVATAMAEKVGRVWPGGNVWRARNNKNGDRGMPIYGYARVSTDGQSLASQDAQLRAAGCAKVYSEKISGVKTDRPELAKVIKRLDTGDVLMVTRLDRLARSTRDLLNILDAVGKAGAAFKSLGDTWADTTTPHGRLMLTVLGGLAEFERELILARTGAGRARAKAQGVRFGRPRSLTPHQRREAMERLAQGAAQAELARSYGVSQSTISRLAAPGPFGAVAAGVPAGA